MHCRSFPILLGFMLLVGSARASTGTSGDISGVFPTGEIYIVVGDLRVPAGQTLVIEPGVQIRFTGLFKFIIEGRLDALGTADQMIRLTRDAQTEQSKWRGLRFDQADDASIMEYCHIEWAKGEAPYPEVRGGAVWVADCSPTFRHCLLNDNYSHNGNFNGTGGAIGLEQNSNSLVEYNQIRNNQADSGAGIMVGWGSNAVIRFNLIEDNQAFYAGGGIYIGANSEAAIHGNIIRGNTSGGWGGGGINLWSGTIYYGTYSHVYNNLIVGNSATASGTARGGGGLYSRYDTSRIHHNTVAGNSASQGGGLYVLTYSNLPPQVFNSIYWNNSASAGPQIFADPSTGSVVNVSYTDVQGGFGGSGNIDAAPLFVEAALGDYHLTHASPCRDAGNSLAPGIPATDFEGDARIVNGAADMGADEYDTRLYFTGDFTPGGSVRTQLLGWPLAAPVYLGISLTVLDPPLSTGRGDLYLQPPLLGLLGLGSVPPSGMISLDSQLPVAWPGPYSIFAQALVANQFSPLADLRVE